MQGPTSDTSVQAVEPGQRKVQPRLRRRRQPNIFGGVLMFLLAAIGLATVSAQPVLRPDAVPEALRDWQQWVLYDSEHRGCPYFLGQAPGPKTHHSCLWPDRLALDIGSNGARFDIGYKVLWDSWVLLPGDLTLWPEAVEVNGQAQTLVARSQHPALYLAPGEYRISGRFSWDKMPESLMLPPNVALIDVRRDGEAWPEVTRRGSSLWLSTSHRDEADEPESANTTLWVSRQLDDQLPLLLKTVIRVDVSGPAREEVLGRVLPDGFVILDVDADYPLRIDEQGRLIAQLRAGSGEIRVTARALSLPEVIVVPPTEAPWPAEEVWSFQYRPQYRVAQLEGVPPIDGRQTQTPWPELPNYLVQPGDQIVLVERSRGLAANDTNQLRLKRQLWLDFAGDGYSVRDQLAGRMIRGWRLDLQAPLTMQSATVGGEYAMITVGAAPSLSGFQVLDHKLNVETSARLSQADGGLPVNGYTESMEQVDAVLNLPPGYRLIAADADRAPEAWLERWNVLDVFLLLVVAAAAWRLMGPTWGLAAGAYLLLGYQESGAPVWSLLLLIVVVGLSRLTPTGFLQRLLHWLRNGLLLALVLIALPFVATQVRNAVYPQLERPTAYYGAPIDHAAPLMDAPASPAPMRIRSEADPGSLNEIVVTGSRVANRKLFQSNALVQAGYGRPEWNWNTYSMHWSGPVAADQTARLLIAPAWLTSGLRIVLVLLLVAVVAKLFAESLGRPPWLKRLLVSLVLIASAVPAAAQTPDTELLDQLRQRLLVDQPCAPDCATIADVSVTVADDVLAMTLTIDSADRLAVPLPSAAGNWLWRIVRLNGEAGQAVYRHNQQSWIFVEPGIHSLQLQGPLLADRVAVSFPLAPKRVLDVELNGWQASGVSNQRLVGGLSFSRQQSDQPTSDTLLGRPIQPATLVQLRRTLRFTLQWSSETVAERLAPQSGAVALAVPLLSGESPQTNAWEIADGQINLTIGSNQSSVRWESDLQRAESITLTAADRDDVIEVWQIAQTPLWQLRIDGVPRTPLDASDGGGWLLTYYPRRGETLTVAPHRPEPVVGSTVAIDNVSLRQQVGQRSVDTRLEMTLRASRPEQHSLALPEAAEVNSVRINGAQLNLRPQNGRLLLPVNGGHNRVEIAWREASTIGARQRTPSLDVGASAANINLSMNLPGDRWVLWTQGPRRGPAVLYWSELLVLFGVAWVLGRLGRTPLKARHWLLLGLGFSTFSWFSLLIVAGWFFVMAWRGEQSLEWSRWRFNIFQLALVVFTVAALVNLIGAIPFGLLGSPQMNIKGGEGALLGWFYDRTAGALPVAAVWSVPMWWYKLLMLAWALWLALALTRWLPWAWRCLVAGGAWRGRVAVLNESPNTAREAESDHDRR